eukprot:jgi/Hompol1/2954/HPOL_006261-RA
MGEYEDSPPKRGVFVTEEQATALIQHRLGKSLRSLVASSRGYNNRLYYIELSDGGRVVLKLCGRFWTKVKTDSEVAGLSLVSKYTDIPVPRLMAWNSDKSELGAEFVLLQEMPGIPLDQLWPNLDAATREHVVRQIAAMVVEYKTKIPKGSAIGCLVAPDAIDPATGSVTPTSAITGGISVGKTVEQGIGPWKTYKSYLAEALRTEMADLSKNPVFEPARWVLPQLTAFIESIETNPIIPDCSDFVFTHGDLHTPNILVEKRGDAPDQLIVTAILDWEWAGYFPAQDEFMGGHDFIEEDDQSDTPSNLRTIYFDLLEAGGVATPRTIPGWQTIQHLSDLRNNIAHWSLKSPDDPNDPSVALQVSNRSKVVDRMLKLLSVQ